MNQENKSTNTNSFDNNDTSSMTTIEIPIDINQPIYTPYINSLEEDNIKNIIYSRCRAVKFLTIIDILFLILNIGISIYNKNSLWIPSILLPFCISGFYGVTHYKKYYLYAYNFYLCIMTIYYFTLSFYLHNFLFLLMFGFEFYFFIYTIRLFNYMNNASQNIIDSLKDGWKPSELTIYYY